VSHEFLAYTLIIIDNAQLLCSELGRPFRWEQKVQVVHAGIERDARPVR